MNYESTFFWKATIFGAVGCAIILVGIGAFTVNWRAGAVIISLSLPVFCLSWKNNVKYRKVMECGRWSI